MGGANIVQCHFKFGVNDGLTSDPDSVNFGSEGADLTNQEIDTPIHIRIQVFNDGDSDTGKNPWQLYYDTNNTPATATQVTTISNVVKIVNDANIADATATDNSTVVFDESGTYTWTNGYFIDASDDTPNKILSDGNYTDFQFNIQFDSNTVDGTTYYFFLRQSDTVLDSHNAVPAVTITPIKTVRYVNTDSTAGGDGTTNATTGGSRAYASLVEWEAAEQANLPSVHQTHTVYCSGSVPDTTSVDIIGWTTNANHTITIKGENLGIEGTGYQLQPSGSNGIWIQEDYVTIDGIEIYEPDGAVISLIKISASGTSAVIIKNNILHADVAVGIGNLGIFATAGTCYAYNNIIYDIGVDDATSAGIRSNGATIYSYNNTISNIAGQGIRVVSGTVITKNTLAVDCVFGCFAAISGTFGDSDYNVSDDGTSTGGLNDRTNQSFTFVNYEFGNPSSITDLHLSSTDGGAIGWGIDLSEDADLPFSTDIDGDLRDTDTWDCGAHDVGAVSQMVYNNGLINITIYIDTDDIDRTDYIRIFAKEDIDPSDINPSAIDTSVSLLKIKSRSDPWEETSVSDFYVFEGILRITDIEFGRRSYFYVIYDELDNEGTKSEFFSTNVCFTPKTLKISDPTANEDETTITFNIRT